MWKTLFTILLLHLLTKTGTSSKSRLYYIHKRSNDINISLHTFLYTTFTSCVSVYSKTLYLKGQETAIAVKVPEKSINISHSSRFHFILHMVIILEMKTLESFKFVTFRGLKVVFFAYL